MAWYGFAVPRGTPQPVIDKIMATFNEALKDQRVRELLEKGPAAGRADER